MVDNAITRGGIRVPGSPLYICGSSLALPHSLRHYFWWVQHPWLLVSSLFLLGHCKGQIERKKSKLKWIEVMKILCFFTAFLWYANLKLMFQATQCVTKASNIKHKIEPRFHQAKNLFKLSLSDNIRSVQIEIYHKLCAAPYLCGVQIITQTTTNFTQIVANTKLWPNVPNKEDFFFLIWHIGSQTKHHHTASEQIFCDFSGRCIKVVFLCNVCEMHKA